MKKLFFVSTLLVSVVAIVSCKGKDKNLAMDNQIPVTGFERTLKLDLDGTRFNVPYGYLAGASRDSATRWPSDEQTVEPVQLFSIYVHPKWEGEKLTLEPFNEQNKDKFIKKLKDGLADVDQISIRPRKDCRLGVKQAVEGDLRMGAKRIHSQNEEYEAYERITEKYYEESYYRLSDNPVGVVVTFNDNDKKKFSILASACFGAVSISYYPSIVHTDGQQKNIQKMVLEYQSKLEELINGFTE